MLRNAHIQNEESVRVSRSKSKNQMVISTKLREKVRLFDDDRKAGGMIDFIWIIFLSIITRTNPILNVLYLS